VFLAHAAKRQTEKGLCQVAITIETILTAFEDMGLRNTRPRRLMAERLASLAASATDFSTDELWQELKQIDPRLGRATVYRTVEVLLNQGVLDRVEFADGTHRYRVCGGSGHHHHVTCTRCHRVIEVETCLPSAVFAAIASQTNFDLEGHSIELFGRCEACRTAAGTAKVEAQKASH
jgi:Fur family ferric uptake transcriptional regulator